MATGMSMSNPNPTDLLPATQQRARQLYETLERYAAELSAADELDPQVRERGMAVAHHAADCARRLLADTERSVVRRQTNKPSSSPDSPAKAHGDE